MADERSHLFRTVADLNEIVGGEIRRIGTRRRDVGVVKRIAFAESEDARVPVAAVDTELIADIRRLSQRAVA